MHSHRVVTFMHALLTHPICQLGIAWPVSRWGRGIIPDRQITSRNFISPPEKRPHQPVHEAGRVRDFRSEEVEKTPRLRCATRYLLLARQRELQPIVTSRYPSRTCPSAYITSYQPRRSNDLVSWEIRSVSGEN